MDDQTLIPIFKGLAHPARLHILRILWHGETCMCQIERSLAKRQPYVSQQLMALRKAGLVESRQVSIYVYYRLANPLIATILESVGEPFDYSDLPATEDCHCTICEAIRQDQSRTIVHS